VTELEGEGDTWLHRAFDRVGAEVVARPKAVIIFSCLVTVLIGSFISQLVVDNDQRTFFVEDDPLLDSQALFEEKFGSDDFVMVYLEGPLFTAKGYQAVNELYRAMESLEYEGKPAFAGVLSPFHAATLRAKDGLVDARPVLDDLKDPTDEQLYDAKERVTRHPVYRNLVVSPDGRSAAVLGLLQGTDGNPDLYDRFLHLEMARIGGAEDLQILNPLLVGGPIFRQTLNGTTEQESALFGGIAVLVCALMLYVMFRRKRQVAASIAVVVISTLWTLGLMAMTGYAMTLISIILPLVIIISGLGSCVHIVNAFVQISATGMMRKDAARAAVRTMGAPCLFTALTTAIGYLSIIAAPVSPMRHLGAFTAIGIGFTFILAITFVPAVLSLGESMEPLPDRDKRLAQSSHALFSALGDFVVARAPQVALLFLLVAALMASGISQLKVETHFLHSLRGDQPFRQAVEHVDEKMGGSNAIELLIDTHVDGGVLDPQVLRAMRDLERWMMIERGDIVGVTLSAVALFEELSFAFTGKRALPETRKAAEELMFLYEQADQGAALGMDKARRIARISIRTRAMTSSQAVKLETDIRARAKSLLEGIRVSADVAAEEPVEAPNDGGVVIEHGDAGPSDDIIIDDAEGGDDLIIVEDEPSDAPPKEAPKPEAAPAPPAGPPLLMVAGTAQLFVHLNDYVIESQINSFSIAAVIIALVMMITLRSVRLGLAIMIPNILPVFATYGFMGWVGIRMDFLTAVVGVAALGVAVDGTIHIGTRYRRSRGAGKDAKGAARDVMTSLGRALVATSVVLTLGFASTTPSVVSALARFGGCMAVCLFLAMIYDLIMTPAVLAWLNPGSQQKQVGRK
jgi:predicted RND superfamily exporter protein